MKVKIGPYKNWVGPYQIAGLLKYVGVSYDKCHDIGGWMADNVPGLMKTCSWIESKRHRKVKVRIDYPDIWSMDSTLALIVAPMLRMLKEKKHGAPHTEDEDVPIELRKTPVAEEYDTDSNHFARWDYILDEMIFAFESLEKDDWEMQFHTGEMDIEWKPIDDGKFFEMGIGPKDTHVFDRDGFMAYQDRMRNGFRLFGKYYFSLWD